MYTAAQLLACIESLQYEMQKSSEHRVLETTSSTEPLDQGTYSSNLSSQGSLNLPESMHFDDSNASGTINDAQSGPRDASMDTISLEQIKEILRSQLPLINLQFQCPLYTMPTVTHPWVKSAQTSAALPYHC